MQRFQDRPIARQSSNIFWPI